MTIKEFEKEQSKLLKNSDIRDAWLAYESRFPHLSQWFRAAPEFRHQSAVVGGKKTGSDVNLYKLFVERSFHLMRPGGHCGIVIPSGIYTDLGAKGLRDLLFGQTQIEGLFCFENRKEIFEGVHRSFKFVVLTFEKSTLPRLQQTGEANASAPTNDLLAPQAIDAAGGSGTQRFPAAFMRHDVEELTRFPGEGALWLEIELIKRLSPDSHSVMEFKSALDVHIAEKMLQFPLLGERIEGAWNLSLTREFDMTNDSHLFKTEAGPGRLPLWEGKMIHQFEHKLAAPRYWVNEQKGRNSICGRTGDQGLNLGYQQPRFGIRAIGRSTDTRTLIVGPIPPLGFCGNSLLVSVLEGGTVFTSVALQAVLNSFVFDYWIRQTVSANLNMFFIMQVPVPRDPLMTTNNLTNRAARLICTTSEFDDLAKAVGLKPLAGSGAGSSPHPSPLPKGEGTGHLPLPAEEGTKPQYGTTDPTERAKLRAELDGLVAHLYGLSEAEFAHILGTFPLVANAVKVMRITHTDG